MKEWITCKSGGCTTWFDATSTVAFVDSWRKLQTFCKCEVSEWMILTVLFVFWRIIMIRSNSFVMIVSESWNRWKPTNWHRGGIDELLVNNNGRSWNFRWWQTMVRLSIVWPSFRLLVDIVWWMEKRQWNSLVWNWYQLRPCLASTKHGLELFHWH